MHQSDLEAIATQLSAGDTLLPPSKEEIATVIASLREALFPHRERTREECVRQIENIQDQIAIIITKAMDAANAGDRKGKIDHTEEAARIAEAFIASLPEIQERCRLDVEAALRGDPAAKSKEEVIACYPGFLAILVYRIAHRLHELGVPFLPRGMTEWAHSETGIDIHPGATIGKGFFIDHGTGVVIGETTIVGDNVTLYQGVTLGAFKIEKDGNGKAIPGKKRHPTVGNGVTVYANATVLGGDTVIGANTVVGAGTQVTKSVPPDSIVGNVPPEVRVKERKRTGPGHYSAPDSPSPDSSGASDSSSPNSSG